MFTKILNSGISLWQRIAQSLAALFRAEGFTTSSSIQSVFGFNSEVAGARSSPLSHKPSDIRPELRMASSPSTEPRDSANTDARGSDTTDATSPQGHKKSDVPREMIVDHTSEKGKSILLDDLVGSAGESGAYLMTENLVITDTAENLEEIVKKTAELGVEIAANVLNDGSQAEGTAETGDQPGGSPPQDGQGAVDGGSTGNSPPNGGGDDDRNGPGGNATISVRTPEPAKESVLNGEVFAGTGVSSDSLGFLTRDNKSSGQNDSQQSKQPYPPDETRHRGSKEAVDKAYSVLESEKPLLVYLLENHLHVTLEFLVHSDLLYRFFRLGYTKIVLEHIPQEAIMEIQDMRGKLLEYIDEHRKFKGIPEWDRYLAIRSLAKNLEEKWLENIVNPQNTPTLVDVLAKAKLKYSPERSLALLKLAIEWMTLGGELISITTTDPVFKMPREGSLLIRQEGVATIIETQKKHPKNPKTLVIMGEAHGYDKEQVEYVPMKFNEFYPGTITVKGRTIELPVGQALSTYECISFLSRLPGKRIFFISPAQFEPRELERIGNIHGRSRKEILISSKEVQFMADDRKADTYYMIVPPASASSSALELNPVTFSPPEVKQESIPIQ